jgi:hypothetical protein
MTRRFKSYTGAFVVSAMCWGLIISAASSAVRHFEPTVDPVITASVDDD